MRDARGATIDRWLRDGRSYHRICYADNAIDTIQFNVYTPDEMTQLLRGAGFVVDPPMTWWTPTMLPDASYARYQLVCERQ